MRMIPTAVATGAVAAGGLLWFGYPHPAQSLGAVEVVAQCDIVYVDGSDYVDEMGRFALERTPLEIRRVAPSSWVVVLFVKPISTTRKDLRTGRTFEQATRTPAGRPFAGLPVVTDPAETQDAMRECITGTGSPS